MWVIMDFNGFNGFSNASNKFIGPFLFKICFLSVNNHIKDYKNPDFEFFKGRRGLIIANLLCIIMKIVTF